MPAQTLIRRLVVALAALFVVCAAGSATPLLAGEPDVVHTAQAEAKIDLNTASVSELMSLKGIGKTKAEAIVAFREQNGPFKSVDDLRKVKGIGAKTLDSIREQLTVGAGAVALAQPANDSIDDGDEVLDPTPPATSSAAVGGRININTASASELTTLKGIGKKTAEKIIEHRAANGPFKSVDDLRKVKGIGAKTLDSIREQLTVDGGSSSGGAAAAATTTTPSTSLGSTATKLATASGEEDVIDLDDLDSTASASTPSRVGGSSSEGGAPPAKSSTGGRININTASASELTTLKGIGKKTAEKIIEHRAANGPFKSVDDLRQVKGIGAKTLDSIREQLTVD